METKHLLIQNAEMEDFFFANFNVFLGRQEIAIQCQVQAQQFAICVVYTQESQEFTKQDAKKLSKESGTPCEEETAEWI